MKVNRNRDRAISCEGKKAYGNEAMAQRVGHRRRLAPYLCQFCRQWHLGSQLRQKRATINEKLSQQFGIAAVRRLLDGEKS